VLFLVGGNGLPSARGALQTFELKVGAADTGWVIEYDDTQVISPTFSGTPTSGTGKDGNLDLDRVIFSSNDFIDIRFKQVTQVNPFTPPPDGDNTNFGLRITLHMEVENSSSTNWSGMTMRLIDTGTEFNSGDTLHPGYAHFHRLAADNPQAFPPFVLLSAANPTATARTDVYELGGGLFADGTANQWTGIGIHQWEEKDTNRDFTLRLQPHPVPEPGTFTIFIIGCASIAGLRRIRQRERAMS